MKRFFIIAAAVLLLCGCTKNEEQPSGTTGVTAESVTVTFAETEPSETTAPVTEQTEAAAVLKDNQLEFKGKKINVLMEFTGAEPLHYYPNAINQQYYSSTDYILHARFTVTNTYRRSFDFIPQKILIRGSRYSSRWYMQPITESGTGLVASDKYYSLEPEESVTFDIDFIGPKDCIEYANEIVYAYELYFMYNNIKHDELNNVADANEFHMTNRTAIKKAVSSALDISNDVPLPFKLTPEEGEYLVNTDKNSYCFSVEKAGRYIRVHLRLACLTGEPEIFQPLEFKLVQTENGVECGRKFPKYLSFDPKLCENTPTLYYKSGENGFTEDIYDYVFDLYIRPDGTAEYSFYYSADEGEEFGKFIYEGENDSFEKEIIPIKW